MIIMTQIATTAYTPSTIGNIKFRIPLYQRPYAWEENQVKQLMTDLYHQYSQDPNSAYYIGIVSVGKTKIDENLFDLIDGQQRVTTLTLIGLVLKEYYSGWSAFLTNRLDLYGREDDKKFIENLNESAKPNQKMIAAVKVIREFMEQKKVIEKEKDFSVFVYTKASVFISEVPQNYTVIDKNLQFVRMNNRGKQLEATDVLKIKLASKIEDASKRSAFINEWTRISQMGCQDTIDQKSETPPKKLSDILAGTETGTEAKESEIFYQSTITFPEILLFTLKAFDPTCEVSFSEENRKSKLLEYFGFLNNFEKWDFGKVTVFMELLKKHFDVFDKYIIKRDREQKYKLRDNELFSSEENSLQKLIVFQSYMYVSRESQHWLPDVFTYFSNSEIASSKPVNSKKFLNKLKEIDNNYRSEIPNIATLRYGSINLYWFWRLDYYLWERRSEFFKDESLKIAEKYVFRSNRSKEHIAPQNPQSNSISNINDIDRFGNLAMISSGQNSSLQNESFEVKRAHVNSFINKSKSGSIESLKLLKIHEFEVWNNSNVENHEQEMYEILKDSYQQRDIQNSI